jgi:mono/diheme cytochrome c family protein
MDKRLLGLGLTLLVAAAVPPTLIAISRSQPAPQTRLDPVPDMDKQAKFKAQRGNPMFADLRAMRPLVAGVVAREDWQLQGLPLPPGQKGTVPFSARPTGRAENWDSPRAENPDSPHAAAYGRFMTGLEAHGDGKRTFVTTMPVPVTKELLQRGQERYAIYCAPCHGLSGYGDGMVARRAVEMQANNSDAASGWNPPKNYHTDEMRARPVGYLYNIVANGIRTMPAYSGQIPVADRWAIVAYLKALQRSQHGTLSDVPPGERGALEK